ncbi:MAG: hypothetical protein GY910_11030 [bacterium]|nr:hypothetical protein [bacterium]
MAIAVVASACASPIGVKRVDPRVVQRELAESVLTSKRVNGQTRNVLRLANLEEDVNARPEEVVEFVHRILLEDVQRGETVSRLVVGRLSRGRMVGGFGVARDRSDSRLAGRDRMGERGPRVACAGMRELPIPEAWRADIGQGAQTLVASLRAPGTRALYPALRILSRRDSRRSGVGWRIH